MTKFANSICLSSCLEHVKSTNYFGYTQIENVLLEKVLIEMCEIEPDKIAKKSRLPVTQL